MGGYRRPLNLRPAHAQTTRGPAVSSARPRLNGAADRIRTGDGISCLILSAHFSRRAVSEIHRSVPCFPDVWAESTAELRQKFRLAQRFTTFACSRRLASKLMKALDSSACSGESSSSLCARGLRSEHRALKQQHHPPLLVFVRLIGKRVEREYGTVRAEHVLHQRGPGEVVSAGSVVHEVLQRERCPEHGVGVVSVSVEISARPGDSRVEIEALECVAHPAGRIGAKSTFFSSRERIRFSMSALPAPPAAAPSPQ